MVCHLFSAKQLLESMLSIGCSATNWTVKFEYKYGKNVILSCLNNLMTIGSSHHLHVFYTDLVEFSSQPIGSFSCNLDHMSHLDRLRGIFPAPALQHRDTHLMHLTIVVCICYTKRGHPRGTSSVCEHHHHQNYQISPNSTRGLSQYKYDILPA